MHRRYSSQNQSMMCEQSALIFFSSALRMQATQSVSLPKALPYSGLLLEPNTHMCSGSTVANKHRHMFEKRRIQNEHTDIQSVTCCITSEPAASRPHGPAPGGLENRTGVRLLLGGFLCRYTGLTVRLLTES